MNSHISLLTGAQLTDRRVWAAEPRLAINRGIVSEAAGLIRRLHCVGERPAAGNGGPMI